MLTAGSAKEKREIIRKTAEAEEAQCGECELVEDAFSTLLDVLSDGVKSHAHFTANRLSRNNGK